MVCVLQIDNFLHKTKNQISRHKDILQHLKIWFCLLEVTIQPSDKLILAITKAFVKF